MVIVLFRNLGLLLLFGIVFASNGYTTSLVVPDFEEKNLLKRKKPSPDVAEQENIQPSPITAQRYFFSPLRRAIVTEIDVTSPFIREIHKQEILEKFYTYKRVNGKSVYQKNELFNITDNVLSSKGIWETNLERMRRGCCPVAYKGIATDAEIKETTTQVIRKKQKYFRIELQHVTQKDTDTDQDPIVEMTHAAHMGKDARIVVRYNKELGTKEILASSLSKEDAENFLQNLKDGNCSIETNILHFRKGSSFVDRSKFGTWRENYWKKRAEEFDALKQGTSKKQKAKKSLLGDLKNAEGAFKAY